jgi:ribosomal protein S26
MKYKGLRESEKGHCYFFHCEHCGSWEQIPMEKFVQDLDKDDNPNIA